MRQLRPILFGMLYIGGYVLLFCPKLTAQEISRVINFKLEQPSLSQSEIDRAIEQAERLHDRHPDSAIVLLRQQYKVGRMHHYTKGVAHTLLAIGHIQLAHKENVNLAMYYFRAAYPYCIQSKHTPLLVRWNRSLGNAFLTQGNRDSAAVYYFKGLSLSDYDTQMTITLYRNIGGLYGQENQYSKTLYYLKKAEELANAEMAFRSITFIRLDLAAAYIGLAKFDLAKQELEKLAETTLSPYAQAVLNMHYGIIYQKQGKPQQAVDYFSKAVALHKGGQSMGYIDALSNLGAVYLTIGDYNQALHCFKQALKKIKSMRTSGVVYEADGLYNNLAETHQALGNYQEAYHFRTLYAAARDSINRIEKVKVYSQLDTRYRSAEKDKQIAESQVRLLAANQQTRNRTTWLIAIGGGTLLLSLTFITLLQRQRLRLQKARTREQQLEVSHLKAAIEGEEKERSRIGRQLHDEVMVEFSIVRMNMAALPQQHAYVKQLPDYRTLSRQLDVACLKLRQAAHNLMPDALMEEGLLSAIQYFCTNVQESSGLRITFQHYGELPELPLDKAVSLYRILQELIQNVIKHAAASRILVQVSYRDGQMDLTVEDNGKGFENADQTGDGMGLKSIRMRLQALAGSMEIRPVKPQGTSVHIEVDAGVGKGG